MSNIILPEKEYSVEDAAQALGFSVPYFKQHISGRITGYRRGVKKYFLGSELMLHSRKRARRKVEAETAE